MALGKPLINSLLPFDASSGYVVAFSYSGEDFTKRQFRISNQDGTWLNTNETASTWSFDTKEYSITIPANSCTNGNGYILQIRVGNTNDKWSEWSNGAFFWCYTTSSVSIAGSLSGDEEQPKLQLANNSYEFVGVYNKPTDADEWYSCQYVLKQSDFSTGTSAVIGNSGLMYYGKDGAFPSYKFDGLSQTNGVVYTITLSCNTRHGSVLTFTKSFTVYYVQPNIAVTANLVNLKDENDAFTGKIQVSAAVSRLRADNTNYDNSFTFTVDPNDNTNYYLDLSADNRTVTYSQGFELLGNDWNIYIHAKNFQAVGFDEVLSPINGLVIGRRINKNPFIQITEVSSDKTTSTLMCYYDSKTKHFYVECNKKGIVERYSTTDTFSLKSSTVGTKTIYTDMVSILIRRLKNDFYITAYKV